MSSPIDQSQSNEPRKPTTAQWLALSVIIVLVLALGAAHAPPSLQRPGPTALFFAVLSGVCIGGIAVVNHIRNTRLVFLVACPLLAASIAGMTFERYRLYVNSLKQYYLGDAANSPQGGIVQELLLPGRMELYETKKPFAVYLTFRLAALGIKEKPWPWVFWIGEIVLGGLTGGFAASRWLKWQSETQPSTT